MFCSVKLYPSERIAITYGNNIKKVNQLAVNLVINDNVKISIEIYNKTEEFSLKDASMRWFNSKVPNFIGYGGFAGQIVIQKIIIDSANKFFD